MRVRARVYVCKSSTTANNSSCFFFSRHFISYLIPFFIVVQVDFVPTMSAAIVEMLNIKSTAMLLANFIVKHRIAREVRESEGEKDAKHLNSERKASENVKQTISTDLVDLEREMKTIANGICVQVNGLLAGWWWWW